MSYAQYLQSGRNQNGLVVLLIYLRVEILELQTLFDQQIFMYVCTYVCVCEYEQICLGEHTKKGTNTHNHTSNV